MRSQSAPSRAARRGRVVELLEDQRGPRATPALVKHSLATQARVAARFDPHRSRADEPASSHDRGPGGRARCELRARHARVRCRTRRCPARRRPASSPGREPPRPRPFPATSGLPSGRRAIGTVCRACAGTVDRSARGCSAWPFRSTSTARCEPRRIALIRRSR